MSSSDSDESSFDTKNDKNTILSEDVYVKKMEEIIERHYYPDNKKMRSILTGENNTINNNETTPLIKQIQSIKNTKDLNTDLMTLDEFLSVYSGEDNISFEKLSEKEIKKKINEYQHFYKNEGIKFIENTKQDSIPHIMSHNAWKYTVKNALMYNPTGVEFTKDEIEYRNKNCSKIDPMATRLNSQIDYITKEKIKQIKNEKLEQLQKQGKLGIDGNLPLNNNDDNDIQLQTEFGKFVDYAEPQATIPDSPLMTWGHVDSTPARLTPQRKSIREFSIAPPSIRDEMAYNLGSVISKNNSSLVFKTPLYSRNKIESIKSMRRCGKMTPKLLSPAAKRLIEMHQKKKTIKTPIISPKMKK